MAEMDINDSEMAIICRNILTQYDDDYMWDDISTIVFHEINIGYIEEN